MKRSPKVPSNSYPGLNVFEGVLREATGLTVGQIASELRTKQWKIRAAISGLKRMKLLRYERKGRKVLYFSNGGSLHDSFINAFFQYLLPLYKKRSIKWMMVTLWPNDKGRTSYKRAAYLAKLGRDLEVLNSNGNGYFLNPSELKKTLARAIESAYIEESHGKIGSYVNLTRILARLKDWGIDPQVAKREFLAAISGLDGMLSPSPAISDDVLRDGIRDRKRGYLLYYLSFKKVRWVDGL